MVEWPRHSRKKSSLARLRLGMERVDPQLHADARAWMRQGLQFQKDTASTGCDPGIMWPWKRRPSRRGSENNR